jgi:sugar phosphate isomerase/epimerase
MPLMARQGRGKKKPKKPDRKAEQRNIAAGKEALARAQDKELKLLFELQEERGGMGHHGGFMINKKKKKRIGEK